MAETNDKSTQSRVDREIERAWKMIRRIDENLSAKPKSATDEVGDKPKLTLIVLH